VLDGKLPQSKGEVLLAKEEDEKKSKGLQAQGGSIVFGKHRKTKV